MSHKQKDVGILVCVHNRQELLNKQLAHIERELCSSNLNFSVTILDDCSDVSIEIQKSYNFSVNLIRSEVNLGLISARNKLIDLASNFFKHLLFLDDDLFIFNLEIYLTVAIQHISNGYSVAYCPYINLPLASRGRVENFKYIFDTRKTAIDVANFNGGASLFDSSIFASIGSFFGPYRIYLEEEDLCIRMMRSGLKSARLTGYNFIGIHDQPPGKILKERAVFLLSNRLLFHYRFIPSRLLRLALDSCYIFLYIIKWRDASIIRNAVRRYREIMADTPQITVTISTLSKFFLYRYFNITPFRD